LTAHTQVNTPTKPQLDICFSPALLPVTNVNGKIVVVIDIFRASSAICTALANGIKEIIPVKEIEDALAYKANGYTSAAERRGEVVDGFVFGNSPFAFMDNKLKGQSIVLTTSNCTTAIHEVSGAAEIVLGAFSNISVLAEYLKEANNNVVLLCAGWKNRFSLEDSLFAGALADLLADDFVFNSDSTVAMQQLFNSVKDDLRGFIEKSSHRQRIHTAGIEEDIEYCLKRDTAPVLPLFNGHSIIIAS
jgi:2-phosphosulfolactate phosphatase